MKPEISTQAKEDLQPQLNTTINKFKQLVGDINFNKMKATAESVGRIGEKMLQRTVYSQEFTTLYLEAMLIKTLALLYPDKMDKIFTVGNIFGLAGIALHTESLLGDSLDLGNHMRVSRDHNRGTKKVLSDGTTINPGEKVGTIDINRNIKILSDDDMLKKVTRDLYYETEDDLRELASLCMQDHPRLRGLVAFGGISRFAGPLAKRLGFDINDIKNPIMLMLATLQGRLVVNKYAKNNTEWNNVKGKKVRKKFKRPRTAYISRRKLIELYGDPDFVSLSID